MVPPIATAFGITTSSPLFVLTLVDRSPTAVTVPSVSPCVDPIDSTTPTNTPKRH